MRSPELNLKQAAKRLGWDPLTLLGHAAEGSVNPLVFLDFTQGAATAYEERILNPEEEALGRRLDQSEHQAYLLRGNSSYTVPMNPPRPTDRFTLAPIYFERLFKGEESMEVSGAGVEDFKGLPSPGEGNRWCVIFNDNSRPVLTLSNIYFRASDLERLKPSRRDKLDLLLLRILQKRHPSRKSLQTGEIWKVLTRELEKMKPEFDNEEILLRFTYDRDEDVEDPDTEDENPEKTFTNKTILWKPREGKTRPLSFKTLRNRLTPLKRQLGIPE